MTRVGSEEDIGRLRANIAGSSTHATQPSDRKPWVIVWEPMFCRLSCTYAELYVTTASNGSRKDAIGPEPHHGQAGDNGAPGGEHTHGNDTASYPLPFQQEVKDREARYCRLEVDDAG